MAATLLAIPLALIPASANAAEAHVDNPYVGATQYVNPAWKSEVLAQAAASSDAGLAAKMQAVSNTSTAVWMDSRAAISGADGGLGLAGHLDAALAQKGAGPETVEIVIYDLPGRDCNALASNGELPATAAGLTTYKTEYIDPIAATMAKAKYAGLRIVTIIEPDSLPNIVTNPNVSACVTAGPFYEQGVTYALDKLHAISNVYTYLDMGHAGWLGWPNNASGAATEFLKVANMTAAGTASMDGFISDTANTTPLTEPFFTGGTLIGGQALKSGAFYEWNPDADEATFTADMYTRLTAAGFPASIGMLIDTSRNGWGGAARPTAASTATTIDAFVNESKVDGRPHRGAWCNQNGAGIGELPTASPTGYAASHLDAFVWVKPPGESDGASTDIPNTQGKRFDRMCDPTFVAPALGNQLTNALPNAPLSGQWFPEQFTQLVQNAYPAIGGTGGGDTTAPSVPSAVTVSGKTANSVALSWTASTDDVAVTGYQVFRGSTLVGSPTATSFTDTGLTAATAYSYTVKAFDAAGNVSAVSTAVSATTSAGSGDTQAPTVPSGVTVSGTTASSVALSWTASTDDTAVTGYRVYRGSTLVASPTTTSFTDTGLTASTAYSYTVKAFDAAGNVSAASTAVTGTTSSGGGGGTVTDCTTPTNTTGTIALQGGEYTFQQNEWNSTAGQCATVNPTTGAWSLAANFDGSTGYTPATYPSTFKGCHWGDCTTNSGLPIQVSKLASVTSSWDTTQPGTGAYDVAYDIWFNSTPTAAAQPDGTEMMIWLNSNGGVSPFGSKTGTVTAAGYNWDVWTGNQASWKIISYVMTPGTTSVSNLDIKALIADSISRGSLNASNYLIDSEVGFEVWSGGAGLASNSYSFTATAGSGGDTQAPSVPSGVAVSGTTASSVPLSWTASTDNVGVTGYRVYRGSTLVGSPTTTSFTDTGLTGSTAYSYTVKAVDAAGNLSAASTAVTGTTSSGGGGGGGCSATYVNGNDWGSGFTSTVTVTNTGTAPISGWTVTWTFAGNQQITNSWSGTVVQSGKAVTGSNLVYNGALPAGGNTSFGFQGMYTGSNTTPTLTCTAH